MTTFTMIASDIDGTLVGDDGILPDLTCRALQALLRQGIAVTLVTGMNPWAAKRYAHRLGAGVRVISQNGIFLLENGETIEGAYVPYEVARHAVEIIVESGYIPLVYGEDGTSRYLPNDGPGWSMMAQLIADRPFQPFQAVTSPEALFSVRPAQVSICDTSERTTALYPVLQQALGDVAYVIHQPATRSWLEVNHPEVRKDTALIALADRLGMPLESIIYFGDNYNDQPVFERIPHCVAMGNAKPEIKAMAWRIAPPQSEEGVVTMLHELFPTLTLTER